MPVAVASCPIVLCADPATGPAVRAALQQAGFEVSQQTIHGNSSVNGVTAQLIVIDGGVQTDSALKLCQRLHCESDDAFLPILFLASGDGNGSRRASLDCGADAFLPRPFDAAELIAQVQALLRIKERHDQLAAKASESQRVNQRLQTAY